MNRTPDLTTAVWRKSSYSDGGGTNCVEVAPGYPDLVPVRDSKAAPHGPVLLFATTSWSSFLAKVKSETA
ncbi:DUF397 domain-containing protein [Streptomyces plumbiresistens]|uniref:DUF397 domain-containing protein n=1 Tax=Streptomyces plumbiresistens TaxID=511811 RepID=A0ABP7QG82_9ACTN